jgi:hypothetical protein
VTNISTTRRQQAWKAGQKARADGKPEDANNRLFGTIYYDDWSDGWGYEDRQQRRADRAVQS